MKYFSCLIICLLAVFRGGVQAQELDKDVVALKSACEILADTPQDKDSLMALLTYAKNTNGIDRLRSRCMAGVALSALFTGNTNLYFRARESHERSYPEDKHLLRVDLNSCLVACKECRGEGFVTVQCPRCQGKGEIPCALCKGKGILMNKQALKGSKPLGQFKCETCSGKGKVACNRCGGKGEIARKCNVCKGSPYKFEASRQVQEDFGLIVRGIVKWINNEEVFSSQYLAAKQIENVEQRVAAYKQLIQAYGYREEIKELEARLAADTEKLQEKKNVEKEQESLAKQEVRTLLKLEDSDTPEQAALTIREYLAGHPECKSKIELQLLADQLDEKIKRKQRNRRLLYVLGAVLILLFGLSCISFTHSKREIFKRSPRFPTDEG